VAMVWVEYEDGERTAGTAFAVRPEGILVTNRHLVHGAAGDRRPRRIAIRFADSDQAFPGGVIAASRDWDLALLRVDNLLGAVPVVPAFNTRLDTLPAGTPVALIGYPLGGEPERDPTQAPRVARPVVSAGLLLRSAAGGVEVQGLGAEGASGSPILDGAGEVIAVLYGGRREGGAQVLLAVPAHAALQLLAAVR
jgi:S1-C subfamily serine protease